MVVVVSSEGCESGDLGSFQVILALGKSIDTIDLLTKID